MSIASEIQRIKTNISNAYDTVEDMNGTLPGTKNSANLADAISTIPQGGQPAPAVVEKDVNFYDYDGTLVHSYTKAEFLALTEMPSNPRHSGLTAQGWNWSLADAKTHVQSKNSLNIGQMYITSDGVTKLYIEVNNLYFSRISLCYRQDVKNGVTIDWGDGSSVETKTTVNSNINITHLYNSVGNYVIKLTPSSSCNLTIGGLANTTTILGSASNITQKWFNMLKKVELGERVILGTGSFAWSKELETINMPNNVALGTYTFYNCYKLKFITIPNNSYITSIPNYCFYYCSNLLHISLNKYITSIRQYSFYRCALKNIDMPNSINTLDKNSFRDNTNLDMIDLSNVTSIGQYALQGCENLTDIVMPNNLTIINSTAFGTCSKLEVIELPDNVTSVEQNAFQNGYSLTYIKMPSKLTNIGNGAFQNCFVCYYDFSDAEQVPTLVNKNAIPVTNSYNIVTRIVVPDALYDDWIVATNWSDLAYNIKKASEVDI